MSKSKILLILGSGPGIGAATASKFSSLGYTVVTASRRQQGGNHLVIDLSHPETVEPLLDEVKKRWGDPSVVLMIAYGHGPGANPLHSPLADFIRALNVNTVSAFAAASSAYRRNPNVTFIYTGNATNVAPLPGIPVMGAGKSASAHWIKAAANSGVRIYYVDQRDQNGEPAWGGTNGLAHAELFARLANNPEREDPLIVFRA